MEEPHKFLFAKSFRRPSSSDEHLDCLDEDNVSSDIDGNNTDENNSNEKTKQTVGYEYLNVTKSRQIHHVNRLGPARPIEEIDEQDNETSDFDRFEKKKDQELLPFISTKQFNGKEDEKNSDDNFQME